MSDGPWGYDDAAPTTVVTNYTVETNNNAFDNDEYPIERNISLKATTSEYIAAYRALTPKFNPIDLSAYNRFKFQAKGTGTLIVRLVKESVANWETQYKTTIGLTEELTDYSLLFSEFESSNGMPLEVNDVTSIVFTMLAENGIEEIKEMNLQHLRFSTSNALSVNSINSNELLNPVAVPNPMTTSTKIHFTTQQSENVTLSVYNQLGALVKEVSFQAVTGKNEIPLYKGQLTTGLYFCKVESKYTDYKTTKLLLE